MLTPSMQSQTFPRSQASQEPPDDVDDPDQIGVYMLCHAVYTAASLQHAQFTCSIGCPYIADIKT